MDSSRDGQDQQHEEPVPQTTQRTFGYVQEIDLAYNSYRVFTFSRQDWPIYDYQYQDSLFVLFFQWHSYYSFKIPEMFLLEVSNFACLGFE